MRFDLVLKLSGIIKRRTIARALAESGKIFFNGCAGKSSREVKQGDRLLLHLGQKENEIIITFVNKFKREYLLFEQTNKDKNNAFDA